MDIFKGKVTSRDAAIAGGIVAVACLLCAVFYFLVFSTQQKHLMEIESKTASLNQELKLAREKHTNYADFEREFNETRELVESFEGRLPDERDIPKLLRQFEAVGDELGLAVDLATLPVTSDANKETIPYKVTARGTFHQIVSFINRLERDERYLAISDLDIKEEQAGVSEATFTLSTFRFLKTSDTPPTAQPGRST